ncbi:MAG: hypothetical protein M3Y56_12095 [Armatimonadota bacterium]|nr:hypothetical protein [Armatimonadota bacterium]
MLTISCTAKVREDGSLSLSMVDQERLGLQTGDDVEIILKTPASQGVDPLDRSPLDPADNPLLQIIGIGKGGPPDGGTNHDKYLYGKRPE